MLRKFVLIMALFAAFPAGAADVAVSGIAPPTRVVEVPFPRSERARTVYASDACWTGCGATCAAGLNACLQLRPDAQARCLASTDSCDRSCQRECRVSGGPLLPDVLDILAPN